MQKIISLGQEPNEVVQASSPVSDTSTPVQDQSLSGNTGSITVQAITPLTWKAAGLGIKTIKINSGIKQWMDHDTGIRNWVNSCITAFQAMPMVLTWSAPVPDQYVEDMGVSEIVLHRVGDDVVHVMN